MYFSDLTQDDALKWLIDSTFTNDITVESQLRKSDGNILIEIGPR